MPGLEGIIEACPGGWNKAEACPGGIYKSVPGRWRYNISLSRGTFIYCPRGGGGGGGYVCNYCRGIRLNNGIAQIWMAAMPSFLFSPPLCIRGARSSKVRVPCSVPLPVDLVHSESRFTLD